MIARLLVNWPFKLGAFAVAVLMWILVSNSQTDTTQGNFRVPIEVVGVGANQVAIGVPDQVELSVTGPSTRMGQLRPESFNATLDLDGLDGGFNEPITVQAPRSVNILRTNPSNVIGFVETVSDKGVPVEVALLGEGSGDERLLEASEPAEVRVRGRTQQLDQVTRAIAAVPAAAGSHQPTLYAADAAGRPVSGITLEPAQAAVTVRAEPILVARTVPLAIDPPDPPTGFTLAIEGAPAAVDLVGPPSVLAELDGVRGTVVVDGGLPVDPATGAPGPGRYTLPVELALPDGVAATAGLTVGARLARTRLDE